MQPFDARKLDLLAKVLGATARGPETLRDVMLAERLDDARLDALNEEVIPHLLGEAAEAQRARFRDVYAASVRGADLDVPNPPPPEPSAGASSAAELPAPPVPPPLPASPAPPPLADAAPPESAARPAPSGDATLPDDGTRPPTLPFLPAGAPRLSLEQVATYHAEVSLWPEHIAAIAARYGLHTEPLRAATEAHWGDRLRDALLRARHDAIFAAAVAAACGRAPDPPRD